MFFKVYSWSRDGHHAVANETSDDVSFAARARGPVFGVGDDGDVSTRRKNRSLESLEPPKTCLRFTQSLQVS